MEYIVKGTDVREFTCNMAEPCGSDFGCGGQGASYCNCNCNNDR